MQPNKENNESTGRRSLQKIMPSKIGNSLEGYALLILTLLLPLALPAFFDRDFRPFIC